MPGLVKAVQRYLLQPCLHVVFFLTVTFVTGGFLTTVYLIMSIVQLCKITPFVVPQTW